MTDLEKVTAQRDLLLWAILENVAYIKKDSSMFNIAYSIANIEQASLTVHKEMNNA